MVLFVNVIVSEVATSFTTESPTTRSADKFVKTLLHALLFPGEIRRMCCYWTTCFIILFGVMEINLLSSSHPRADDELLISKTPIGQSGSCFETVLIGFDN